MAANRLKTFLIGTALLLGSTLYADERPDPADDPLPQGARARFGLTRPILRNNPRVALIAPKFTNFLAPTTTGTARRYDLGTGKPLEKRGAISPGLVVASENGKRAVVSRPSSVTVIDVATGDRIMTAQAPEGIVIVGVSGVSLSADGKVVAYGARGRDGKGWVVVCDVDKKETLAHFETIHAPVFPTLSRDGTVVISHGTSPQATKSNGKTPPNANAGQNKARTAQIWNAQTGTELHQVRLTGMGGAVVATAFSPDGALVAISGGDGPIDLWDVKSGKRVRTILGKVAQGTRLAISPDGKTIASVGPDYRIERWTIDGQPLEITNTPAGMLDAPITGLQFADNERVIAWLTLNQFVVAWEAPSGKMLSPVGPHAAAVHSVSFGKEGKEFYTSGRDGRVVRWHQPTGKLLETIALHPARNPNKPMYAPIVNLTADAARAVWTQLPIEVFDMASTSDIYSIPSPGVNATLTMGLSTSGDKAKFFTLGRKANDRTWSCVIWDMMTEEPFAEFEFQGAPVGSSTAAVLSPSEERLFISYFEINLIGLSTFVAASIDVKTGKKIAEVRDSTVAFNSTGSAVVDENNLLLASNTGRLYHVDYAAGRILRHSDPFPVRPNDGLCMTSFSPDRKLFAVGIAGKEPESYAVRVYDWPEKKIRGTFEGHLGPITVLQFSPDGKSIVTGSEDSSALLWDLEKLPAKKSKE